MALRPKQPTVPRPFHNVASLAGPKHIELWRVKEAGQNRSKQGKLSIVSILSLGKK
jgi:hypothetical protein